MENIEQATREFYWNIQYHWLLYVAFGITMIIFGYGLYKKIQYWKMGKPDKERLSDLGKRVWWVIKDILFQRKVLKKALPGVFHIMIFWMFLVMVVVTTFVALETDVFNPFGKSFFSGWIYAISSVAADVAGLFVLIGLTIALVRRYIVKPKTLTQCAGNTFMLGTLFFVILTGFFIEGLRMAVTNDPWPLLSPVGIVFMKMFEGVNEEGAKTAHVILWWSHMIGAFAFIASIPFTRFSHIVTIPVNTFLKANRNYGTLNRVDIEKVMESADADDPFFCVGTCTPLDFTWKQLLDFDACIGCGRCEEVCPAYNSGAPFSPKQMIEGLRDFAQKNLAGLQKPQTQEEASQARDEALLEGTVVVGNALNEDFIWYCRTCLHCVEVCPASIEHIDSVINIRRSEIMMQGRIPTDAGRALKTLERLGNPFGPQDERIDWINSMGVPVLGEGDEADYLLFIGCCTTFDPVKQKIGQDLCKVLMKAGVSFGVLGADEKCCGDPARVLGDETQFQAIAQEQIEFMNTRKFKKLLTACPHCYNVFKNEYSQFGGNFEVIHHTELLSELLESGKIQLEKPLNKSLVYHDPCYIARYNGIYDAPRNVISHFKGATVDEPIEKKENGFCCGAGGGHYYMDLMTSERINNLRINQLTKGGADTIVTACAYCNQMLTDSILLNEMEEKVKAIDLVCLVAESMGISGKESPAEMMTKQDNKVLQETT